MTSIRHSSAWGDDGEEAPPRPIPVAEPQTPVASTMPPGIISGQLSHALVLAFEQEKPRVGGWGALAKRLGIHTSLLQRLRAGIGNVSSVDEVASKLGWQIVIRRPHD